MNNFYIVRFNDLSKEKQAEIKRDLIKRAREDTAVIDTALVFDDPRESIEKTVEKACDKSWVEMEFSL